MTSEEAEELPESSEDQPETGENPPETPNSGQRRTHRSGPMERALKRDLRGLGTVSGTFHSTFAQLATVYARALDGDTEEAPTPGDIARLGQQLRATLAVLSGKGGALDQSVADEIRQLLSAQMGNGTNAG